MVMEIGEQTFAKCAQKSHKYLSTQSMIIDYR